MGVELWDTSGDQKWVCSNFRNKAFSAVILRDDGVRYEKCWEAIKQDYSGVRPCNLLDYPIFPMDDPIPGLYCFF